MPVDIRLFLVISSLSINFAVADVLEGQVLDERTGEPVAGAHVFFNRTMIGTFTDENGRFLVTLPAIMPLELVVTHVSYQTRNYAFDENNIPGTEMNIMLVPNERQLAEVEIRAKPDRHWKRNMRTFINAFLGSTENAGHCQIVNPQVIDFQESGDQLVAYADDLLEIVNDALGFRIYFLLEHFAVQGNEVSYSGKPYFEPLPPGRTQEWEKWLQNREKTYYGSLRHFLKSLVQDRYLLEGYQVYRGRINANGNFETSGNPVTTGLLDEATRPKVWWLDLNDMLKIIYTEREEINAGPGANPLGSMTRPGDHELDRMGKGQGRGQEGYQTSYLFGRKQKLKLYSSGILDRPELVRTYGYWGEMGMADLLPYDYSPGD